MTFSILIVYFLSLTLSLPISHLLSATICRCVNAMHDSFPIEFYHIDHHFRSKIRKLNFVEIFLQISHVNEFTRNLKAFFFNFKFSLHYKFKIRLNKTKQVEIALQCVTLAHSHRKNFEGKWKKRNFQLSLVLL